MKPSTQTKPAVVKQPMMKKAATFASFADQGDSFDIDNFFTSEAEVAAEAEAKKEDVKEQIEDV